MTPSIGQIWIRKDAIGAHVGEAIVVRICGELLRMRITRMLCHDEQVGQHFQCTVERLRHAGYWPTAIVEQVA